MDYRKGPWTLDDAMDNGPWTLDDGPWTMDPGRWTVASKRVQEVPFG